MSRNDLPGARQGDRGIRWRSHEITRIEGFSDAVFAFAVTLLVVSLEVPETFHELRESMDGFIAFALGFALLFWIWYNQYVFFRRYAMNDGWTLSLNGALLFVVLFFVYPLKFLFVILVRALSGSDTRVLMPDGTLHQAIERGEGVSLMVIYGAGYAAIFTLFWLMYRHAAARRVPLGLDERETFLTRAFGRAHLLNAGVGVLSILIVLIGGDRWSGIAGWTYALVGPVMAFHGSFTGKSLRRLESKLAAQSPTPPTRPPTSTPTPSTRPPSPPKAP